MMCDRTEYLDQSAPWQWGWGWGWYIWLIFLQPDSREEDVEHDQREEEIQDPLPTLLFLRLPLCCFCDPLCCFCGPLCWNVFPFCWFGDPFCCFWSAKWECVFPKCHPPSRMLILYLSRINNSGPSKAKNQQFLSNKTESTNCVDQSLVGSFQDLQMIALWKLSLRRRQSSISPSFLLSFLSLL